MLTGRQLIGSSPTYFNIGYNVYYNMPKKSSSEIETIEAKILSSLLEGPKTNTQLLEILGYDTNRHANITKPLKKLNRDCLIGYKSVISEKIDDTCKLWSLIPTKENFMKILNDYPSLLTKMHKKELVLDSLFDVATCSETVFDPVRGVNVKTTFLIPEEVKKEMKEMMRLSPEFFKIYFSTTDTHKNARELTELVVKLESKNTDGENRHLDDPSALSDIATVFKTCVLYDAMWGQSSEEAIEYLLSKQRKIFEIDTMQIISRTTV